MSKPHVTAERLREIFSYDPETGILTRKGKVVGTPTSSGYLVVSIDGRSYKAHRLAWLYVHGSVPDRLDHINRIKTDNRIANLREVSSVRNHLNITEARSDNVLGVRGVSRAGKRFRVSGMVAIGKVKYLGTYATIEEASAVYQAAKAARDPEAVLVP